MSRGELGLHTVCEMLPHLSVVLGGHHRFPLGRWNTFFMRSLGQASVVREIPWSWYYNMMSSEIAFHNRFIFFLFFLTQAQYWRESERKGWCSVEKNKDKSQIMRACIMRASLTIFSVGTQVWFLSCRLRNSCGSCLIWGRLQLYTIDST